MRGRLHTVLFTSRRTAFDSWQHEADTAVQNVGKDPTGTSVDFYIAPGDWQCDTPPGMTVYQMTRISLTFFQERLNES